MIVIDQFKGTYRFLSSFYPYEVIYEDVCYPSREHGFAAAKTLDQAARLRIAAAKSASEAKRLGRNVSLREGWDQRVKFEVMRDLITFQFAPNSTLGCQLTSTGDAELIEGNTWHDNIWGDCRCGRHLCAAPGQNHLGKLLMARRDQLLSLNTDPAQEIYG